MAGKFRRLAVVFLLLTASLFAVLTIPVLNHASSNPFSLCPRDSSSSGGLDHNFEWTIFITPQGFIGAPGKQQRRAIQSWLRLTPRPNIVLAGRGDGYDEVAAEFGLTVDPRLDLNFISMPLAGSLIKLATTYPTQISCIVNSDILLTQSFVDGIAKIRHQFQDWFLTGARYDIDELPHVYEPSNVDFSDAAFAEYVRTKGVLHTAGGLDYFVWNNNGKRLMQGTMPPFIRGKSKFDNWFVHEVIQAGYRNVIDGSEAVVVAHVVHTYQSADGKVSVAQRGSGTFWQKAKTSNWMIFHNNHLAILYGSYRNQDGTTVHTPWKMSACEEPAANGMCLIKRLRPGICPCEHNAFAISTQNDPEVVVVTENDAKKSIVRCGSISQDNEEAFRINVVTAEGQSPVYGLPFTMRDLLPLVARNNLVILTGVTYAYRDVLMNFVCNLRRLGIFDQLLIAAFDEETYRFGFRMGLPVFYYESQQQRDTGSHEAAYGSEGFKSLTKLKSQIVLQILHMGYDVVWTDTDIVWYQNPIPLLGAMKPDLVVQSNAPWPDEQAANGPLRINSGFYRVRSTPVTIAAFEAIVAHARSSSMTEQPSFYIVLCGGKDGVNVKGDSTCVFRPSPDQQQSLDAAVPAGSTLDVEFLNRLHYPNGAVGQLWEAAANISTTNTEVVVLHNNWIRGLQAKVRRLIDQRLWFYSRDEEICDYSPAPAYELNWNVDEMAGEEA